MKVYYNRKKDTNKVTINTEQGSRNERGTFKNLGKICNMCHTDPLNGFFTKPELFKLNLRPTLPQYFQLLGYSKIKRYLFIRNDYARRILSERRRS